jgi:hypothetical protein
MKTQIDSFEGGCVETDLLPSQEVSPDSPKYIICLLSRDFNQHWFDFLKTFNCPENYSIYMVIDRNPDKEENVDIVVDSPSLHTDQPFLPEDLSKSKIKIVQVSDRFCIQNKYYKSSSCTNLKDIVAWDKALCFFNFPSQATENWSSPSLRSGESLNSSTLHSEEGLKYDYIWFFEDDVFFHNLDAILNIDAKYPTSDFLSAFHEINADGNIYNGWNHWCNVVNKIKTPWAHSLVSASRLSSRLMEKIDEYVKNNNSLMFIEALFSTLSLHNGFKVDNPEELATSITYDKKWNIGDIVDKRKIYHPLKKIEEHKLYRENKDES